MNSFLRYFIAGVVGSLTFLLLSTLWAHSQSGPYAECFTKTELLQYHVDNNGFTARDFDAKGEERDNYIFSIKDQIDINKVMAYLVENMGEPPAEYGIMNVNRLEHISLVNGGGMLVFYADECSHNRAVKMPAAVFTAIVSHVGVNIENIEPKKVSEVFEELNVKVETF